jgi:hypothetical protein
MNEIIAMILMSIVSFVVILSGLIAAWNNISPAAKIKRKLELLKLAHDCEIKDSKIRDKILDEIDSILSPTINHNAKPFRSLLRNSTFSFFLIVTAIILSTIATFVSLAGTVFFAVVLISEQFYLSKLLNFTWGVIFSCMGGVVFFYMLGRYGNWVISRVNVNALHNKPAHQVANDATAD